MDRSRSETKKHDAYDPSITDRHPLPDMIRVFALIGIATVNVGLFAWPFDAGYFNAGLQTQADDWAYGIVNTLLLSKSHALFSLMFGASFGFQLDQAQRRGNRAGPRHVRRLAGLFAIGLLHAIFFFRGDILMTYAICGGLLFFSRHSPAKALATVGAVFITVQAMILFLAATGIYIAEQTGESLPTADPEWQPRIQTQIHVFTTGKFFEAAEFRLGEVSATLANALISQGIGVFGYFCLGLALLRSELITQPAARFWSKCRYIALPIGGFGGLAGAVLIQGTDHLVSGQSIAGHAVIAATAPFLALGYAGVLAHLCLRLRGRAAAFISKAGSATLSAYLVQSIALSLIFSGYGWGLYAKLGAVQCILIGASVGIASILAVAIWRIYFKRGPVEILLRRWTYLGTT
ncbi:MAG: DUF418 domain-containing protein [Pseudomonadota bacterium]